MEFRKLYWTCLIVLIVCAAEISAKGGRGGGGGRGSRGGGSRSSSSRGSGSGGWSLFSWGSKSSSSSSSGVPKNSYPKQPAAPSYSSHPKPHVSSSGFNKSPPPYSSLSHPERPPPYSSLYPSFGHTGHSSSFNPAGPRPQSNFGMLTSYTIGLGFHTNLNLSILIFPTQPRLSLTIAFVPLYSHHAAVVRPSPHPLVLSRTQLARIL